MAIGGPRTTPSEGSQVGRDRYPVQGDRFLDRLGRHRNGAGLNRSAEEQDVGRRGRTEQRVGQTGGVGESVLIGSAHHRDALDEDGTRGWRDVGVGDHLAGRDGVRRCDHDGAISAYPDEVRVAGTDEEIEGQQAVDAGDVGVVRHCGVAAGDPQVADHRTRLL